MFRLVWVDFGDLGWIKTIRLICNGSAGFRSYIDVGRFCAISTICWIGIRIDLVIFEFGLDDFKLELLELSGGSGQISVDSIGLCRLGMT